MLKLVLQKSTARVNFGVKIPKPLQAAAVGILLYLYKWMILRHLQHALDLCNVFHLVSLILWLYFPQTEDYTHQINELKELLRKKSRDFDMMQDKLQKTKFSMEQELGEVRSKYYTQYKTIINNYTWLIFSILQISIFFFNHYFAAQRLHGCWEQRAQRNPKQNGVGILNRKGIMRSPRCVSHLILSVLNI